MSVAAEMLIASLKQELRIQQQYVLQLERALSAQRHVIKAAKACADHPVEHELWERLNLAVEALRKTEEEE
jgi:hypothetical protein